MRAALEASDRAHTAVLTKLYPTRSHTGAAQGGMCAALANVEEDNWEWHTFDTVKGGDYLVDQDAAEVLAREAIETVIELEHMGLPFNRTPDGKIDQRRFGGHARNFGEGPVKRSCFAADRTGHMILQTLYQQCVKAGVRFYDEYHVVDLVFAGGEANEGGRASGVVAYRIADGSLSTIRSKAVLLATGGFGRMFRITSNAWSLTGDGVGLAELAIARAQLIAGRGAELVRHQRRQLRVEILATQALHALGEDDLHGHALRADEGDVERPAAEVLTADHEEQKPEDGWQGHREHDRETGDGD